MLFLSGKSQGILQSNVCGNHVLVTMFSQVPFICEVLHATKSKQIGISNVSLKFVYTSFIFSEWLVNQHRDSAASYIGHYNLLDYFALVENETRARTKFNLLEVP